MQFGEAVEAMSMSPVGFEAPFACHTGMKPAEAIVDNAAWQTGVAGKLTIAIPTYRDDACPMIDALSRCARFDEIEIVLFDDGAGDEALNARFEAQCAALSAPMRFVSAHENAGRSAARNRLLHHARADWLLLLDADMLPDADDFLARYLDHIDQRPEPGLCVGGFSLKLVTCTPDVALHYWQAQRSECLTADERRTDPGRFVYTSNVLVHRKILEDIAFDHDFVGWGWEDVDWGLRVAEAAPVIHIDNTATHMGLDPDKTLMSKYGRSGENFAYILDKHPQKIGPTPLGRNARRLARLPGLVRHPIKAGAGAIATLPLLPVGLRGRGLKLWRALVYAEALA